MSAAGPDADTRADRREPCAGEFHAEVFEPGNVYFLNAQNLGKNAGLVPRRPAHVQVELVAVPRCQLRYRSHSIRPVHRGSALRAVEGHAQRLAPGRPRPGRDPPGKSGRAMLDALVSDTTD